MGCGTQYGIRIPWSIESWKDSRDMGRAGTSKWSTFDTEILFKTAAYFKEYTFLRCPGSDYVTAIFLHFRSTCIIMNPRSFQTSFGCFTILKLIIRMTVDLCIRNGDIFWTGLLTRITRSCIIRLTTKCSDDEYTTSKVTQWTYCSRICGTFSISLEIYFGYTTCWIHESCG